MMYSAELQKTVDKYLLELKIRPGEQKALRAYVCVTKKHTVVPKEHTVEPQRTEKNTDCS